MRLSERIVAGVLGLSGIEVFVSTNAKMMLPTGYLVPYILIDKRRAMHPFPRPDPGIFSTPSQKFSQ